jgi:hypothetical protein
MQWESFRYLVEGGRGRRAKCPVDRIGDLHYLNLTRILNLNFIAIGKNYN